MCGIVGLFSQRFPASGETFLASALQAIIHRGPDDQGIWSDPGAGVGLGHRRLSILDLSPAGHQPMHSASGRYVFVFNGEIYNYALIRQELEKVGTAPSWRGHSDTEVILAAFETWGVQRTLEKLVGMFAFALWDRTDRVLTLARDRVGEKPLYYGRVNGDFVFGSELKALRVHPAWKGEIDRGVLALFLRHNYVPSPYCIFRGIRKLAPGTYLTLHSGSAEPIIHAYWSARSVAESGAAGHPTQSDEEATNQLEALLKQAVAGQMIADVPLGAFLSGGIDSSTVVALMQAQSKRPVKTFSIGFHEEGFNEAEHAKAVARHLGTEHTELYVTPTEAMAVIPRLPSLYDEPFADSSQVPTFLVSQMTRKHVTVALSGDAGDELFGGYNRYLLADQLWRKLDRTPGFLRGVAAGALTALSPSTWDCLWKLPSRLAPRRFRFTNFGDKLHKLAGILALENGEAMYRSLVSHWPEPADLVIDGREPPTSLTDSRAWADVPTFLQRVMFLDLITYLPDDILVKVDRAAMGVSLETRIPMLDHRVVEFAWRVPLHQKIRDGETKWLLRQVLYRYIPKHLIERPKMGFGVPIDSWLRGPLKEWAATLLDASRMKREGFFDPAPIQLKWAEHLSGSRNWQYPLWDVLMFQAWLETQ
jgi:asparagine synthase (glutamine-hydrolysing)